LQSKTTEWVCALQLLSLDSKTLKISNMAQKPLKASLTSQFHIKTGKVLTLDSNYIQKTSYIYIDCSVFGSVRTELIEGWKTE
jgi:hypothetical protein